MKDEKTKEILQQMLPYLDNAQMAQLQKVLEHTLWNCTITESSHGGEKEKDNHLFCTFARGQTYLNRTFAFSGNTRKLSFL